MPSVIRPASWDEVEAMFYGHGGGAQAISNALGWAKRYGLDAVNYARCAVTLESWSSEELYAVMDEMAEVEPRMIEDVVGGVNNALVPPRLEGLPAVFVRLGHRYGIIDGKHRVNRWKHLDGNFAVLVIHA